MTLCNEEGCQVAITGICVNGLKINECPHYHNDLEASTIPEVKPVDQVQPDKPDIVTVVDVHNGKALSLSEVNRITTNSITRFVILAGMPDAGKTTLLLSLLHLFATNPGFEGFLFAGSETLLDYEMKSHFSKIDSGNYEEDTQRTAAGLLQFLHLKVASQADGKITDLLFTDISGEDFRALRDSGDACKKFIIGKRADHFVLFFDTLKITTFQERPSTKASG